MKIKELFSGLFKLRNAVCLKKNPLQKNGNSWEVGGSTNNPLEGKFEGGGGKTKEPSMGGMDIFWNPQSEETFARAEN